MAIAISQEHIKGVTHFKVDPFLRKGGRKYTFFASHNDKPCMVTFHHMPTKNDARCMAAKLGFNL